MNAAARSMDKLARLTGEAAFANVAPRSHGRSLSDFGLNSSRGDHSAVKTWLGSILHGGLHDARASENAPMQRRSTTGSSSSRLDDAQSQQRPRAGSLFSSLRTFAGIGKGRGGLERSWASRSQECFAPVGELERFQEEVAPDIESSPWRSVPNLLENKSASEAHGADMQRNHSAPLGLSRRQSSRTSRSNSASSVTTDHTRTRGNSTSSSATSLASSPLSPRKSLLPRLSLMHARRGSSTVKLEGLPEHATHF